MRVACRHLVDALDRLSGSTLSSAGTSSRRRLGPSGRPVLVDHLSSGPGPLGSLCRQARSFNRLSGYMICASTNGLCACRSAEAWGNSLRARGALTLSVLRTCVTKQTKDLRYMGRGTLMVLEHRSYAR